MARRAEAFLDPARLNAGARSTEIRALIVEDERLFGEALQSVLGSDEITVDRVVPPGPDVPEAVRQSAPDVVILGVDVPTQTELRRGEMILDACPATRVLILAATMDRRQAQRVLRAGFHGCLSKDASVSRLVRTLRAIVTGAVSARTELHAASDGLRRERRAVSLRPHLTPREREVLELIATGASGRTIARRLGISENTVRTHSQSILVKLQVHSRLEAATYAIRNGIIRLGSRDAASLAG